MATSDDDDEKLILFQCKECNVIITDSSNSDGANDNMGIVKLQDFPETLYDGSVLEIGHGMEKGCSYFILSCSSCDAAVGKFYKSVCKDLLDLKGHATLKLDKLKFYSVPVQINSRKVNQTSFQDTREPERKKVNEEESDDDLKSVRSDITKMKYVMCHFDERLRRIEKTLCLPDIEEEIPEIDGPMVTGASMVSGASMFSETGPQDITAEVNSPNSTRSLTQRLAVAETSLEKQDRSRSFNRSDSISRRFSNSSRTSTTESTPRKSQKRQTSSGSRSPEGKFKKRRK